MASRLWSGSVNHSPAAAGNYVFSDRPQTLHGSSDTCRFGSKRPVVKRLFCSASSSTVVRSNRRLPAPSPPSDFKASPVPLLLVPQILLDKDKYDLGNDAVDDRYVFYSLSEEKILTVEKNRIGDDAQWIGSSKGWIMYMSRNDCNLYLYNPFSSSFVALPSIETLPGVDRRHYPSPETDEADRSSSHSKNSESSVSSIEPDFEFLMQYNWYYRKYEDPIIPVTGFSSLYPIKAPPEDLINRGFISKMALSSDPTSPSNTCAAIMYGISRKLAICRVGDKRWTPVEGSHYYDIYFSRHDKSKLFVSAGNTGKSELFVSNFGRLSMKKLPRNRSGRSRARIISPDWDFIPKMSKNAFRLVYLVESATEARVLLMVRSSETKDVMVVYKLNLLDANKEWARVESLDDQALFVGEYSEGLAIPATQLPAQLKPNCIYFTNFKAGQVGVFKLEEKLKDLEAFNNGICLDLSHRSKEGNKLSDLWMESFRKVAEGWPVWVAPNLR